MRNNGIFEYMQDEDLREEGLPTAAFEIENLNLPDENLEENIVENDSEMSIEEAYKRYEEHEKNEPEMSIEEAYKKYEKNETEEEIYKTTATSTNNDAELERHIDEQLLSDIQVTRPENEIDSHEKKDGDENFDTKKTDNEKDI